MKIRIITIILIAFIANACEKEVDMIIPDNGRKLVVNSMIANDSLISVNVSQSLYILDNDEMTYKDNAKVSLFGDGVFIEELNPYGFGNYLSEINAQSGVNYKIEVESDTLGNVWAECNIPDAVQILEINSDSVYNAEWETYETQLRVKFKDDGTQANYYMVQVEQQTDYEYYDENTGEWIVESYRYQIYIKSDDLAVEATLSDYNGLLFSDDLFNGSTYEIRFTVEDYGYFDGDDINSTETVVNLYSLDRELYLYQKSYEMHRNARDDFFSEPVQVYNNINGGFGIFGGYSIASYAVEF